LVVKVRFPFLTVLPGRGVAAVVLALADRGPRDRREQGKVAPAEAGKRAGTRRGRARRPATGDNARRCAARLKCELAANAAVAVMANAATIRSATNWYAASVVLP
jgi:hypothetical protein